MKNYNVKFRIKDKGLQVTVYAENEAMAKQRVLAMINFVDVKEVTDIIDFLKGFGKQ